MNFVHHLAYSLQTPSHSQHLEYDLLMSANFSTTLILQVFFNFYQLNQQLSHEY